MVERADISQVLSQMRALQAQLQRPVNDVASTAIAPGQFQRPQAELGFGELLSRAIGGVNDTQQQANRLRDSYEGGQAGVSLTQVMVAAEKSSVAFEAMTQVRNKLIDAYKEIMSMPV